MSIREIVSLGGLGIVVLMSLIQIVPIEVNPWTALAKALGRAINADVMTELAEMKKVQKQTREKLEEHIDLDDERMADTHRTKILRFNNELLRDIDHTKEEFIEALADIDEYESYCKGHPAYKNNRAVHAIGTIKRVYDERMEKHDFLQ